MSNELIHNIDTGHNKMGKKSLNTVAMVAKNSAIKVALRPHSAQKIVTYFPAYFDELRHILSHCSIYSYYNSYLDS